MRARIKMFPIKRQLLLVLLPVLLLGYLFSFSGCGNRASNQATGGAESALQKQTVITTSFYPMYIMTRNVAKDIPGVTVVNLTEPYIGCLHDYQLTTNDLKRLQEAGILVINGAGMESFLDKVISQQPDLRIVEASQGIELIKDEDGEENPHVWVSISLAMQQVRNIAEQLASLDPVHAEAYRSNAEAYLEDLKTLRDKMHAKLQDLPRGEIITFHEAFPYFAREFDLRIAAVIEREPGSEPNAAELASIIRVIKETGIHAMFAEPQYSAEAAQAIARDTGARVYTLDPAVTGPDDPDAYLTIMESNLKTLREALGGK